MSIVCGLLQASGQGKNAKVSKLTNTSRIVVKLERLASVERDGDLFFFQKERVHFKLAILLHCSKVQRNLPEEYLFDQQNFGKKVNVHTK